MTAYYNEFNPQAAQWLRNLIKDGLIAAGEVDERSITEVKADEVRGFTQCHFFAGIGGWSYALRLAGWPDDRPVWTGSCPCQPFASAGKKAAQSDERHLWPHFARLVRECHPPEIFGEQVASAIAHGWLDDAFDDLEAEDYACGAAVLPACSVGAPHQRDRVWFAANNSSATATGRYSLGRWVGGMCEMEETITYSDEARREDGQMESRLREAEITLNRCAFVEAWQDWTSGFGGFGRLDDGVSPRVAKSVVAGFGNAIVPKVAAEFINAYQECRA